MFDRGQNCGGREGGNRRLRSVKGGFCGGTVRHSVYTIFTFPCITIKSCQIHSRPQMSIPSLQTAEAPTESYFLLPRSEHGIYDE